MKLLDRVLDGLSYRDTGYYEGMASGASVLFEFTGGSDRETVQKDLIQACKQAYSANGVVFACILARAMLLSDATFKFRDKTDKSLRDLPPRAQILENPWPNGRAGDLWMRMEEDASMAGNFYGWKAADDLIWRLPPHEVIIISQVMTDPHGRSYRQVIGYDWQPGPPAPGQKPIPPQHFTVDEIVHWAPIPDPAANFRGMSWLTPVLIESSADSALTSYKHKYLNYGTPVTAIKYAARLRPETIDAVTDRMQKKYGGVANAWRPLVLDQGADPVIGKGLQDLDFRAIAAAGEERICGAAGVPPVIVGLKEASSAEVYEQAMRSFGDRIIRPLWRSGCAALEQVITVPAGQQLWVDTTDIAALQDAETDRAQVMQVSMASILTGVQAGYTRESVVAAVNAHDLSLLKPDPNAPPSGLAGQEKIQVDELTPVTDENGQVLSRPPKTGSPPGGGQVLTQPQTPASKLPAPAAIPTAVNGNRRPNNPSPNGRG